MLAGLARPAGATRGVARRGVAGIQRRGARHRPCVLRRDLCDRRPRPETEALGTLCREYDVYHHGAGQGRHPDWPDRYFNIGFILDPEGEVILIHYKTSPLFPVEHSMCPHDVSTGGSSGTGARWMRFGLSSTPPIGRLGIMMANEGSYPENARALAMNGAEVVYRASIPHPCGVERLLRDPEPCPRPRQQHVPRRAEHGHLLPDGDVRGADRHVRRWLDDRRLSRPDRRQSQRYGGVSTSVCGPINIEALRHHRATSPWTNWMKDLRTEMYQMIYEDADVPENLYKERAP